MHLDKEERKYSSHGIILDQVLSKHFDNGDPVLDDLDQDDPDPKVHDLHNDKIKNKNPSPANMFKQGWERGKTVLNNI